MRDILRSALIFAAVGAIAALQTACATLHPGSSARAPAQSGDELTPLQKLTIQQLTSIFENSTTRFQYSYIEDIGDGAGITCGMVGFTGGELLLITSRYVAAKGPDTPLAAYLPCLKKMGDSIEQDYSCLFPDVPASVMATQEFKVQNGGISRSDFGKAWVDAGQDPLMRKIQRDYVDETYYDPAMQDADQAGIHSALGKAMFYDENIQMDSMREIVAYAQRSFARGHGGRIVPSGDNEEALWLGYFQEKRAAILNETPVGAGTVPRVDSLNQILAARNMSLALPFQITYFDDRFTLNGESSKGP